MRRLVTLLVLLASGAALAALALSPGCGNQCNHPQDCKPPASGRPQDQQVCYKGNCVPASAGYVRCYTNKDCNKDPMSTLFVCRSARCVLSGPMIITPDAGLADLGPVDATTMDGTVGMDVPPGTDAPPGMDAPSGMDAPPGIDAPGRDAAADAGGGGG